MSDPIKHECGIALIRLRKKLSHFHIQKEDSLWGFRKLLLMMEKQRPNNSNNERIQNARKIILRNVRSILWNIILSI